MKHHTRLYDMDAAKQAYQFGRNSYRKDVLRGTTTRNPYPSGTIFYRAFEEGRSLEQTSFQTSEDSARHWHERTSAGA